MKVNVEKTVRERLLRPVLNSCVPVGFQENHDISSRTQNPSHMEVDTPASSLKSLAKPQSLKRFTVYTSFHTLRGD